MKISKTNKLTKNQKEGIRHLIKDCRIEEGITLDPSLENENYDTSIPCFFLGTEKNEIIAFLCIYLQDESYGEVMGFTHPMARRRGYFTELWNKMLEVLDEHEILEDCEFMIVTDGKSKDAIEALKALDGEYQYTEYSMIKDLTVSKAPAVSGTFQAGDSSLGAGFQNTDNINVFSGLAVSECNDLALMTRIHDKIFREGTRSSESFIQVQLDNPDVVNLLFCDPSGQPAGLAHILNSSRESCLFGFGLLPEYQGQKLSRPALRLAESYMKGSAAVLQVSSLNEAAFGLYSTSGYEVKDQRLFFY